MKTKIIALLFLSFVFMENCLEMYQEKVRMRKKSCKTEKRKELEINSLSCSLRINGIDNPEEKKVNQDSCLIVLAANSIGCK